MSQGGLRMFLNQERANAAAACAHSFVDTVEPAGPHLSQSAAFVPAYLCLRSANPDVPHVCGVLRGNKCTMYKPFAGENR